MEKLTPQQVQDMLRKKGKEVTIEQATAILDLLRKLATTAVTNYLKTFLHENR